MLMFIYTIFLNIFSAALPAVLGPEEAENLQNVDLENWLPEVYRLYNYMYLVTQISYGPTSGTKNRVFLM